MTRVSFYVLESPETDRGLFICRLLERIYAEKQRVYAHVPDPLAQQRLNEQLWTFKQGSFIPHDLEQDDSNSPIVIGSGAALPAERDVLLNLDFAQEHPPEFFASFSRTLEIVAGDPAERAAARQRYGYYRDRGYELNTHKIP